ncbi:MAG: hypothetical protein AB7O66_24135 [Limisphaerales bacterium]
MDQLKKLGVVFGAHYEKIILSVILLALLGAAAFLPFRVAQNRETIRQALELGNRAPKKVSEPVDTSGYELMLKRLRTTPRLVLSGEHNLFNPVLWKRGRDGAPFKVVHGDEDGPGGLVATEIRPLELVIEFNGIQESGESVRYKFSVLDETKGGKYVRPRQMYLSLGSSSKNDPFVVTRVIGPAEDPTGVEFRFADSTETATVTRDQPFKRVAGHEADLVHEKLGTKFNNVRSKQPGGIRLGSQIYNIVAINKDEVTVQSSTSKRWIIRRKGVS